jgi:antitoxin (DNA-binding transcriptional repressor) of toxin-antitoxin stability system
MRKVSVQELEQHIPDLQAGQSLTLVYGGKPLAEVVPIGSPTQTTASFPKKWASEEERLAELDRVMARLREGWDLGGLKIVDRDALYGR